MLTIEVVPAAHASLFAPGGEGLKIASVVLTGQRRKPALKLEVPDEAIDPAGVIHGLSLETLERCCYQVSQARQEIDAHAWMEAVTVHAAYGEKADLGIFSEGHQGSGPDVF